MRLPYRQNDKKHSNTLTWSLQINTINKLFLSLMLMLQKNQLMLYNYMSHERWEVI